MQRLCHVAYSAMFAWGVVFASALTGRAATGPNLLTNGDVENGATGWEKIGKGFAIDVAVAHRGKTSLRCSNAAREEISGARQLLELNQRVPVPLVMRGWSRARDVSGIPDAGYSLYCDVEYTTDTRPGRVDVPGLTVQFQTGTHDWVFGERTILPAAPIKWVKFYALFRRNHTGTVWFDDLYIGPVSGGPLSGTVAEFPSLPDELTPKGFREAVASLPPDQALVHVVQRKTQPYHVDPMRLWLGGELVRQGTAGELSSALLRLPWRFPRGFVNPPASAPFTGVWLRRRWGETVLDVHTQGKDGAAFRYTIALPAGVSVRETEVDQWEPSFDDVRICRLGDRIVLSVLTETQNGEDRASFHVLDPTQVKPASRALARRARRAETLRTADGLELDLCADGWIDGLRIGGRDVVDRRIMRPSADPLTAGAGLYVGDLFGRGFTLVGGRSRRTKAGLVQRAEPAGLDLDITATYTVRSDRIDIEVSLEDKLGVDRAIDVVFKLPLAVEGWTWWEDINHGETVSARTPVKSSIYPWATLTSPDGPEGAVGLTLAIPPHRPCVFTFHCEPADRLFYVRFPVALTRASKQPSRTVLAFALFRTDGKWGFRDAARRYYAAFPEAFRRLAKKEGGWLFVCPTGKLKNPEDYAYNESSSWQVDETLGILTCPYRIPTQRQIRFPNLPRSNEEAVKWIERLSRTFQPTGWKLTAAVCDDSVCRRGARSLRCETNDPKAVVDAAQDVALNQESAKPIVLGGWCRAENVTGEPDPHFSLHADISHFDGTWLWGQCVQFRTGTHDWELGEIRVESEKPVRLVRLHVLMRRGHTGRAWFDDIFVREQGSDHNFVRNPGFEEGGPHAYATMMKVCASHDAQGRPYIVRRDNVGSHKVLKRPIYNVVYAVNCDPDLFEDRDVLTAGRYELDVIQSMLNRTPEFDGIYLDSTSGWVSRHPNYRRAHFRYVDHPLTYDARSGRPVAPGWMHTYEFMAELQKRLTPQGKVVFPNIGRGRTYPFFYFVCDVIGLEGGLRTGPFESRLNFYRTLAYQKPVLIMDYLDVVGRPTRLAERAGFERFWKWCVLYGCHPSIGDLCVEAYERFGDVYRRFRTPLKKLGAAGWEPVTYASAGAGILVERFGNSERGLYFTLFNPSRATKEAVLQIDAPALKLPAGYAAADLLDGRPLPGRPIRLPLAAEDVAVIAISR
ncbi:MAG: hypothetical protein GXP31_13235 [Kiritimatiellaeota bacterium]|nr:hypothetical protein [Kiritimatiellota bacterium]